jgi:hypothetical protein
MTKNPGEGIAQIFGKILWGRGVKAFGIKMQRRFNIFGFFTFFAF